MDLVNARGPARSRIRAIVAPAFSLITIACQPLVDPAQEDAVRRCPKPCPQECPRSCLPSGYCQAVTRTAAEMGLGPVREGGSWQPNLSGFPPGAHISYAFHAGFDVVERAGRTPIGITMEVDGESLVEFRFLYVYDSFPLWADYQSQAVSASDGVLRLELDLVKCEWHTAHEDGPGSTCFFDGTSTLGGTLVTISPWIEAPPCE